MTGIRKHAYKEPTRSEIAHYIEVLKVELNLERRMKEAANHIITAMREELKDLRRVK